MTDQELRVGPKGQIVIPPAILKALKIQTGSKVLFSLDGDKIIVKKAKVEGT